MVVEGSVAQNIINKKMEVDSLLVWFLGVENLQQASNTDGSLFYHFSKSDIGFNTPNGSCTKAYPSKE